jgi:hypothetical protein
MIRLKAEGGGLKMEDGSAIMDGSKKLTVRQARFVAELAKGKSQRGAAEAAGYTHLSARRGRLLNRTCIREALESELEAQELTPQYLVARIKDLCEATDDREDGRPTPNWSARAKGAELLMRILGVDKQTDTAMPAFEEILSRMLEDAQDFDPGFSVIDVGNSGAGNWTEIVVLNKQT